MVAAFTSEGSFLNKILNLFLEIWEKQRIEEGTRKQIQLNAREIHKSD